MKTKTLAFIYFLTLSLSFVLGLQPAFAASSEKEELTLVASAYLEDLRMNCDFKAGEFTAMKEALEGTPARLINPISKEAALVLTTCYPYWANFNQIIEVVTPERVDYQKIHSKVKQIISQIRENEERREEAHVKTENINLEMDFVAIPKGIYENKFIDPFEIANDVAIQTTPVTQYQWTKVMGDNPAYFKTGEDSRKVEINGEQIEMSPNNPIESVSYEDITKFIDILNKQDNTYEYQLPSIIEYLAVIGDGTQTKDSHCLNKNETCSVETGSYQLLNERPIYSISDNVVQLTRDNLGHNNSNIPPTNKLLFGFSYSSTNRTTSDLSSITKYIFYTTTSSKNIGFRLVRYKKDPCRHPTSHSIELFQSLLLHTYNTKEAKSYNLIWSKKPESFSNSYIWDQTFQFYVHASELLEWMVNNKDKYPKETQHTIDVLLQEGSIKELKTKDYLTIYKRKISDLTPLAGLTQLKKLRLTENNISDISPLAGLTILDNLSLDRNNISDISPLAGLTKLERLHLEQNNISDISPLAGLTKLGRLFLEQNNISDISPLAGLTELYQLSLSQNNISDISPLVGLTGLTVLYLERNSISDISPLAELTNIYWLKLNDNYISDISPLAGLTRLDNLSLERNNISDISSLAGLTQLKSLFLNQSNIPDISLLGRLTNHLNRIIGLNIFSPGSNNYNIVEKLRNLGCCINC